MKRIALTIAYEGTHYEGWQVQFCTHRVQPPTIQAVLQSAIEKIVGKKTTVHGSGRTDSGVHAEAQVCHFDIADEFKNVKWARALNTLLPNDIRVLSSDEVSLQFHARVSAIQKTYVYTLWTSGRPVPPRLQAFCWQTPELDHALMVQASQFLIGRHDFASLQNSRAAATNTVRTLFALSPEVGSIVTMRCPSEWPITSWWVTGDGFLKQMVRNIIGLLVWVGQKKLSPFVVPEILAACQRAVLPSPTAPAQGLTLYSVKYPEPLWLKSKKTLV